MWLEVIAHFSLGISSLLYTFSFFPVAWPQLCVAYVLGFPAGCMLGHVLASAALSFSLAVRSDTITAYIIGLLDGGYYAGGPAPSTCA